VTTFQGRQRNVGKSFEMQAEDAVVQDFLHQHHRAIRKLCLIADEGEDHSDCHHIIERETCREVDDDDVFKSEDRIIDGLEAYLGAPEPHIRIDEICITIEPLALAFLLTIEQFQALHRTNGLDEVGIFLRLALDDRFITRQSTRKRASRTAA
jgi:hypothetical protein